LRELDKDFAAIGVSVRAITIGSQEKAEKFCAVHNPQAICIGDVDMHTYKAMGLDDFDLTKLKTTPALTARRAENEAAGFVQNWDETKIEDAAQNPGAALIDREGVLRWVYRGVHPGDLPSIGEMFEVTKQYVAAVDA
jgi:hypothetical protein